MLDPALCERAPLPWLDIKGTASHWLTTPGIMIPILLCVALLPTVFLSRRWRWIGSGIALLPLVVYVTLPLPPVYDWLESGLTRWIPVDQGRTADAIVLLGRGPDVGQWQVEVAAELWRQHRAPLIFASGSGDSPRLQRELKQTGVPKTAIQGEDCSQTTHENAQFTAQLLNPQGVRRIILVTDRPHMLRSWLTFKAVGFSVTPHFAPGPRRPEDYRFPLELVREYVGLVNYWLLGRFSPATANSS